MNEARYSTGIFPPVPAALLARAGDPQKQSDADRGRKSAEILNYYPINGNN